MNQIELALDRLSQYATGAPYDQSMTTSLAGCVVIVSSPVNDDVGRLPRIAVSHVSVTSNK